MPTLFGTTSFGGMPKSDSRVAERAVPGSSMQHQMTCSERDAVDLRKYVEHALLSERLAQRMALLRRVKACLVSAFGLAPYTAQSSTQGTE
jgi:hypothetical protein